MSEITLILPDQLFHNHPAIEPGRPIYLAEEFLFFKVQPFHKQRLVLLRAAMRRYANTLIKQKHHVVYISSRDLNHRGALFTLLAEKGVKTIHMTDFSDEWLKQDLTEAKRKQSFTLCFYQSPAFLCSHQDIRNYFSGKEHYSMAHFYAYQRKRFNILMDGSKPVGGKFSFDTENRKKIPKGMMIPRGNEPILAKDIAQIIAEIDQEFPDAYGTADPFLYPTTHEEAQFALDDFLKHKMTQFGAYQDAIYSEGSFLFHSVLSPLINTGLLTPAEVIEKTLTYAKTHSVPMNSLEGFLRQILGWREFVRAAYTMRGSYQRTQNFFHHREKIPASFWQGNTGIVPIDTIVQRILKTGYGNHIERLMVLGNFLLLTETSPHEVYTWFMANFVDSYDWVMVPNVYGMAQFSDGGMIVTKPYVSGANYILKMSNFPKGEWCDVWDGLFWRFIHKHQDVFSSNPRTQTMTLLLKKNEATVLPKIQKADNWLAQYRQG